MPDLDTIKGLTETQPDTESVTAQLVHLLENSEGRSQDALVDGITNLEKAYSLESNSQVRDHIERALQILRSGKDDEDDE